MLFERGGGGTYFSLLTEGGWVLTGAVGAGLIRMTALTRRQTASVRACLKEQYLKCKCSDLRSLPRLSQAIVAIMRPFTHETSCIPRLGESCHCYSL